MTAGTGAEQPVRFPHEFAAAVEQLLDTLGAPRMRAEDNVRDGHQATADKHDNKEQP